MPTTRQYQFDIDTKRYLNKVNTFRQLNGQTNIQNGDAADIDNFIITLKDLNVWTNCTFWPLRQQHNIGTGSNVLGLGGLGSYDGVAINSPTWSLSGINFTSSSSQYIRIPNFIKSPTLLEFSMICVHRPDYTANARALLGGDGSTGAPGFAGLRLNVQANSYSGGGVANFVLFTLPIIRTASTDAFSGSFNTFNKNAPQAHFFTYGRNSYRMHTDRDLNASGSTTFNYFWNDSLGLLGIGARNGGDASFNSDYYQGPISLMMIFNKVLDQNQYFNIYDSLKTTIMKGIGLP